MGDHDEALEQIGGHHVVRMNVEYVAVVAGPHAHLQPDVVRQVEWGLENGGTEGAERFLPQNGSGNAGRQHDVTGKAA